MEPGIAAAVCGDQHRGDPHDCVGVARFVPAGVLRRSSVVAHQVTTSHDDNHPIVLVRLDRIDHEEAVELITDSYRHRAEPSLLARLDRPGPG